MTNKKLFTHEDIARKNEIKNRVSLACKEIKTQFPDSGPGSLMFAVVERAIKDVFITDYQSKSAQYYINSKTIPHAQACGVDSDWVRRVLRKKGLLC